MSKRKLSEKQVARIIDSFQGGSSLFAISIILDRPLEDIEAVVREELKRRHRNEP